MFSFFIFSFWSIFNFNFTDPVVFEVTERFRNKDIFTIMAAKFLLFKIAETSRHVSDMILLKLASLNVSVAFETGISTLFLYRICSTSYSRSLLGVQCWFMTELCL